MRPASIYKTVGILFALSLVAACNSDSESTETDPSTVSDASDPTDSTDVADPADASDPSNVSDLDYPDLASVYAKNRVLEVQVDILEDDWNQLRFERRSMTGIFGENCEQGIGLGETPYNYYPASVTVDDTVLDNIGVRTKGLLGSINPARPSLKMNLHKFIETDDLYFEETKRFTFNNQNQDQSRMRTCMAYYIFAAAGVPASMCNFAHIQVNGSDFGIYANVEAIKKPLLARVFGDDSGNLYEGTASDIRAGGFMVRVEKKTNEVEDDWSDLYQLRDAIEAPDETFRDEIEAILNLDAFINFWASEAIIGHWDGFTGNANNYFLYNNPVDGKFHFIPWGPDGTFVRTRGGFSASEEGDPTTVFAQSKLARRLWNEPDIRIRYQERVEQLLADVWKEEELLGEVTRIQAMLEDFIPSANRNGFLDNISNLRDYINDVKPDFETEFAAGIPEFVSQISENFACMTPIGNLTIDLSTTWGTNGAVNPFDSGSGSATGNYGGNDLNFPFIGGTAGFAEGTNEGDMASITAVMPASEDFSSFFAVLINMPKWLVQANTTVPIDGQAVSGFFVRFVPSTGSFQIMGFVGGTEIQFGDAGSNEGDTINAMIDLEVWGGGEGGNNYGTPVEPPDDLAGNPEDGGGEGN